MVISSSGTFCTHFFIYKYFVYSKQLFYTFGYSIFTVPVRKRQRKDPAVKKSCLSYLTDKQEKDREIKLREIRIEEKRLELEERKLSLEEKKIEIEQTKIEIGIKEREQKLMIDQEKAKLELEERKVITKLLQAQQDIIDNFSKLQNKNSN